MTANCTTTDLLDLLTTPEVLRVRPWHRHFGWPTRICDRMFDDVLRIGCATSNPEDDYQKHFTGIITFGTPSEGPATEMLIVNGQQRLVTITLILLALVHALCEREDGVLRDGTGAQVTTADEILAKYLYLPAKDGVTDLRLKLLGEDDLALKALTNGTPRKGLHAPALFSAYDLFRNRIAEVEDLHTVFMGLSRLHGGLEELCSESRNLAELFVLLNSN